MTTAEYNKAIYDGVSERFESACEVMNNSPKLEAIFNEMIAAGFAEQAAGFRDICCLGYMLQKSEEQILEDFLALMQKIGNKFNK